MSVMSCNRKGCENIMCTKHSHVYGYICNECFEELLLSNLNTANFMDIEKQSDQNINNKLADFEEV